MYEHICTTIIRLDKTETYLSVEPFNCTLLCHVGLLVENALIVQSSCTIA